MKLIFILSACIILQSCRKPMHPTARADHSPEGKNNINKYTEHTVFAILPTAVTFDKI